MSDTNHRGQETRRKRRGPSRGGRIAIRVLQVLGTLLLIGVVTGALFSCYAAAYIKNSVIPNATLNLDDYTLNENSVVYYEDKATGLPVELATLVGKENREWVDYEDIPQDLINAVIAVEDKRFYQHHGVDWYRTAGAFINMFLGMRNTFGGSTITQQLVKNLTQYDDVTVTRKISEIFTALDVERRYEKKDIITWYLNYIYLGNGYSGVQAAAKGYFGKDVSDLTLAECASLAGITNNPSLYSPYAAISIDRYPCLTCKANGVTAYSLKEDEPCSVCGETNYGPAEVWTGREYNKNRQERILRLMAGIEDPDIEPMITMAQYEAAVAEPLVLARDRKDLPAEDTAETKVVSTYSWYVEAVINEVIADLVEQTGLSRDLITARVYSGGLRIYVPYDPDVQAAVDEIYNAPSSLDRTSRTGQKMTSGITVVDNSSGYVVAMAGGIGEQTVNRGWNNAKTLRQPGSSIKPLSVYSPAFEMGLITPATVSDDNPRLLNDKVWPLNVVASYRGLTTIMYGVTQSLNTIAVNVLADMVTPQVSYEYLTERYGITSLVAYREDSNGRVWSDIDVSPLAMGGLTDGVSTYEMAAAFATFPRNGLYTEPTTYLRVEDIDGNLVMDNTPSTDPVIKESTAYYMNYVLTNAVNSGTGYNARIAGHTVAGKTGTTNNQFDLWFAGYTPYYTAVVWTGYPYNERVGNDNPSVTLWQKVMAIIHKDLPSAGFAEPDDLVTVRTCIDCGKLATTDCANDLRGDRGQSFRLLKGDAPTEYCECHVPVVICTESPVLDADGKETGAYYLASELCPEECRKEVTLVDYTREVVKDTVVVKDYFALINFYDTLEDPYCPNHLEPEPEPEPDPEPEPTDPSVDPTEPVEPTDPVEPTEPVDPVEPTEPPVPEPSEPAA